MTPWACCWVDRLENGVDTDNGAAGTAEAADIGNSVGFDG